jgi:putative ABC transport system permease protein
MLGMNIGVAAVIAVMATGLMGRGAVMSGIERIGSTLIWISPNRDVEGEPSLLRPEDLEAIESLMPDALVSPMLRLQLLVGYGGYQQVIGVYGVSEEYRQIWGRDVSAGRFLSEDDSERRQKVIVLGADTASTFFERPEGALGESVNVAGKPLEVVGVMATKERSPIDDGSDGNTSYVPFEVLQGLKDWSEFGGPRIRLVFLKVGSPAELDPTTDLISNYLSGKYGQKNGVPRFLVRRAEQNVSSTNRVFEIITTVITMIAGISLIVGGIGIMNIMLVAVTERTREIGIRKATGARRRDILGQFLVESVFIGLVGGGMGVLWGLAATAAVSAAQRWTYMLPWASVTLGLAVSLAIGLFFGIYPAVKAARLDPVVALSQE